MKLIPSTAALTTFKYTLIFLFIIPLVAYAESEIHIDLLNRTNFTRHSTCV